MKWILKFLPAPWKLQLRILQRNLHEHQSGYQYPKDYAAKSIGEHRIEIRQTIRKGEFHENKIHNLQVVSDKINNLVIQPGEVFSFWKLIGKPTRKNNFKEGRNLIKNNISSGSGGGICQFSSILYYAALQAGLKVIERFPHSIDIYKDDERFTPLGSDCTVVYGYKDLQILNISPHPIQFQSAVSKDELYLSLVSPEKIFLSNIDFKYREEEGGVLVETLTNGELLSKNFYIRL
ncbi:vancomycin resistance protein VanW [Chryseobacterium sp. 52]|uniref:VanW family protein n=1 Tax=Chryseobacterium sp. 52 TaxID=2035213 RepID=UPI000C19E32D|nr:VanW family protein [Chryseobacterium sp. 52]PIF47452.1 vancomycin resistance protein VanW [Chryseobacterium sp. 52]